MKPASALFLLVAAVHLHAQKPENVLVVVNDSSSISRTIGDYYSGRRAIPAGNVCHIKVDSAELVDRDIYDKKIVAPITACLQSRSLTESVLYIVTTAGVPLRITGSDGMGGDQASVDSELTLLYGDIHGTKHRLLGPIRNPFFTMRSKPFKHPDFPIYLVTRLAGYDFADVRKIIDRALLAENRGKFVLDLSSSDDNTGNDWLRTAAISIPKDRVILDESTTVLYDLKDVIGYAAWGSNDKNRHRRMLGFQWLPGAIMTEYVSTNGRTFTRPPAKWNIGTWADKATYFFGSPQTMTSDYIHEGASGASGHVDEPYLQFTPRPDYVLPAYFKGRNLAESYYLGIPALSWQNIVIGDPLCALAASK